MKFIKSILLLSIFGLIACGSVDEQDVSSVGNLENAGSEQELCERYSGKWKPKSKDNPDTLTIRGKLNKDTGKCRFRVTNAKNVTLVLEMDGKPYEAELEKTPITFTSQWTDKVSLEGDENDAVSEKTNIGFTLVMVGDIAGVKYNMTSQSLLSLEGRDKLRLQAITRSKLVVGSEENESQPVERFDETYHRGNWEE